MWQSFDKLLCDFSFIDYSYFFNVIIVVFSEYWV